MGAEPEPLPVRPTTVVLVPFPAQGHVSPMLLMARALAARGVKATVAVPDFVHCRIVGGRQDGVELASIPSGVPDDGNGNPPGFASFGLAMEHYMPARLEEMLTRRGVPGRRRPGFVGRPRRRAVWRAGRGVLAGYAGDLPRRGGHPGAHRQGVDLRLRYVRRAAAVIFCIHLSPGSSYSGSF
jgi:hypothetical protein